MLYCATLAIPANTPQATPVSVEIPVVGGVVRRVWVRWRWGSGNLCGARIRYHEFQYWPLSLGVWFVSSIDPLDFADAIPLDTDPYILTLDGYNLDDTYEHTVWVAFEVDRTGVAEGMAQLLADLGVAT